MTHAFDSAIELTPQGEHRFAGATSAAYANMVGPFGGITSAVMLNAVLLHRERQGEPIALTVNFAAPMVDGAYEIEARPVHTNRSTQHWNRRVASTSFRWPRSATASCRASSFGAVCSHPSAR